MTLVTCALGPDSAGTLIAGLVHGARGRLDVAVYEMSPYWAAPVAAAARGATVRVLLDGHRGANSSSARLLRRAGVACRVLGRGRPGDVAHWKVLVGGGMVAVGTGNLIRRDLPRDGDGRPPTAAPAPGPGTREWWVLVDGARRLRDRACDLVEAAWDQASPPPAVWPAAVPLVAPPVGAPAPAAAPISVDVAESRLELAAGGAAVLDLLLERVSAARRRVLVTAPYVHAKAGAVPRLLAALEERARRGADVRILLGSAPDVEEASRLAALPFPVRVMDPLRCTTGHAKGVVADEAAVVASANWSASGMGGNRELALCVDDGRAAGYYAAVLARDWSTARCLPG